MCHNLQTVRYRMYVSISLCTYRQSRHRNQWPWMILNCVIALLLQWPYSFSDQYSIVTARIDPTRNSSGDEIANVNFFTTTSYTRTTKYNRLVHKFRHRSTPLCVGTQVYQIQWKTQCTVQVHSMSPILVPIESSYTTWLILTYFLSYTVSKLWLIIGQIFPNENGVPHFNVLAGVIPYQYRHKWYTQWTIKNVTFYFSL